MCERQWVMVIKGMADPDSHFLVLHPWAGDLTPQCLSFLLTFWAVTRIK